jgi:uncharacterized protein YbjT (DUF2867 family)
MIVLISGGTGSLGRLLMREVVRAGHVVRIMTQRASLERLDRGVEWVRANLVSGAGLEAAVQGIDTVVHLASNFREPERVDVAGTRRLIEVSRLARVSHIVFISIVGIDDLPTRYYRCKRQAELIIESSGVPYSIQRSTQFHSFIDTLLWKASCVPLLMPLPTDFKFQSVDETEVAIRLCQCVAEGSKGLLVDFGGPDVLSFGEMAQMWLEAKRVRKKVVHLPLLGKVASGLRQGRNRTKVDHK